MDREAINAEVRGLAALDLEGLRAAWRVRYGRPPRLRSVELLGLLLAWKIQADAFGGLDATTKRRIKTGATPRGLDNRLEPGTVITKDFRGVTHQVVALEDGRFRWKDQTFSNISAVALAISGARRSGRVFFGLKTAPKAARARIEEWAGV